MNISDAATRADLPAKTIRYYEEIELIKIPRTDNGYREFDEAVIHKLAFIGRARALGFSIDACRTLLSLYEDKQRASRDVRELAIRHLAHINDKLTALENMRDTLQHLVECCHGDSRPDCPILADLAAKP